MSKINIYQANTFFGDNAKNSANDLGAPLIKTNILSPAFSDAGIEFNYDFSSSTKELVEKARLDALKKINVGLVGFCRAIDGSTGLEKTSLKHLDDIINAIRKGHTIEIPFLMLSDLYPSEVKAAQERFPSLKHAKFVPRRSMMSPHGGEEIGQYFIKYIK